MIQSTLASWLSGHSRDSHIQQTQRTPTAAKHSDLNGTASALPAAERNSMPQSDATVSHCLPGSAKIIPLSEDYVDSFKRLNSLLLPIRYPEAFYTETLQQADIAALTRIAVWSHGDSQKLVGAIRCRLIPSATEAAEPPVMYISTIGVLAPFREHSIASNLLAAVTKEAITKHGIIAIAAHVWESNEDALAWYTNRGFQVVKKEPHYYRRLAPQTAAYFIKKEVRPRDLLN